MQEGDRVISRTVARSDQGPRCRPRPVIFLLFLAFLIVAADQLVKFVMLKVLVYGSPVVIIKEFFSLTLVFNTGAAFGILRGWRSLFIFLPILTVVLIIILFFKSRNKKKLVVSLALILGGTIGNLVDRIRYGCVVDFLDLYFQKWHWPAFNIADICICLGVLLFLVRLLRGKEPVW